MSDTPSFNLGGSLYRIINIDSPSFSASLDNYRMSILYDVAGNDVHAAIKNLKGYTFTVVYKDALNFAYFSRILPHTPSWDPTLRNKIHCRTANQVTMHGPLKQPGTGEYVNIGTETHPLIEEIPDRRAGPKFSHARIVATYEKLPYIVLEDDLITSKKPVGVPINDPVPFEGAGERYVKIRERDASKDREVKGDSFVYTDGPFVGTPPSKRLLQYGVPIRDIRTEITVTWYGIPRDFAPLIAARAMRGYINDAELLGYAAGTLRFEAVDASEEVLNADLQDAINIKYFFMHQSRGWNFFPDPENQNNYGRVERRADPTKGPYLETNFDRLFWAYY